MDKCKDCMMFKSREDEPMKGDCIREQTSVKGGKFWSAKPVMADMEACPMFQKKGCKKK